MSYTAIATVACGPRAKARPTEAYLPQLTSATMTNSHMKLPSVSARVANRYSRAPQASAIGLVTVYFPEPLSRANSFTQPQKCAS